MGQQLNIKSDHAYAVASKLSEMTGESLTTVVSVALDERLERESLSRDKAARLARLRELADQIAAHMEPGTTSDHSWLYDENGLPR